MRVEVLEERRLLTSLDISGGVLTYDVSAGSASALTISIDPSDTSEIVFTDPDQSPIIEPGAALEGWSYFSATHQAIGPANSFSSVVITGSTTMGQTLTLDFTTGEMLTASGLSFTPTAAAAGNSNSLTLTPGSGSEAFLSETYTGTGEGAGTLSYTDSTSTVVPITFSNLSPVTDTVPSPTFIFNAPAGATTVNVVDGPSGTTQINDGGTGAFELINFANKATATVNVENAGATTTVDTTTASAGLSQLYVDSGDGTDTIQVEGTPSGVTTTTDTGSPSGSSTIVGLNHQLTSILGPLVVMSTGGANTLTVDDADEPTAQTYTLDNAVITASSLPAKITMNGTGLATLNLDSSGGSTVNLSALAQGGVTTYNFNGGTGLGNNTLNITSDQTTLNYGTAGTLNFGAGQPTVNYTNTSTVNVTKPATAPVGTTATIKGTVNQALNGVVVATFTDSDLSNVSSGFVASINWGDGTTTAGTIASLSGGSYEITGNHTYAAAGTYLVNVTLTEQTSSGSATVGGTTINVTSNGPVSSTPSPIASTADIASLLATNSLQNLKGLSISAVLDQQTTQDIATFSSTDPNALPSYFTATINWGDGTATTAGTITEDASGVFHVSGTHTYTSGGSFTPVVTIKDLNGTIYATGSFYQTNLVSSASGMAAVTDPNLINPWGMSSSSTSPIWVSDQGSGVTTVYNPKASPITTLLTVTVPPSGTPSGPTGQVFNNDPNTSDFIVPGSSPAAPARFLFATLAGTIDAWASGASAVIAVPAVSGATFTGLAQASASGTYYLYAADFTGTTGANGIDVFDSSFTNVSATTFAGKFTDPNAVSGYEPYNIALLNGDLYVAYARPSGIVTTGGGYIDEFSTSGDFINRVYTDTAGTNLAGPWGMAIAPSGFGSFGGDLLVGNFGNATSTSPSGTIVAINLTSGTLAGTLDLSNGSPAENAGLWGLLFGNGGSGGTSGDLYISAGIDGQTGGLFAQIAPAPSASALVAALSPSSTQPTVSTTEDQSFSGEVASFTSTSGSATTGEFSNVMIDWGDGTSQTAGTISEPGGPGTPFIVSGIHTYADAGVNGGTGHDTITVNVHDANGLTTAITNTANVADVPLTITGNLNPANDSDASGTAEITNVVQPNFIGSTSQPNATIKLYATASGSTTPVLIGTGTSDASGAWSITADRALADGSYAITAVATDSAGQTVSGTTTIVSSLVIDTVGPKVTGLRFDRGDGRIVVTYQDYGGANNAGVGLMGSSVIDASNYQLTTVHHPRVGKYRFNVISDTPGTTTGTQTVTLSINGGKRLPGGWYFFTIDSASPSDPSGVRDIAGNALDGEFYGYFPSGNNIPGGNFVAQLTAIHGKVYAPSTVAGRGTPVSPPGTRAHNANVHTTADASKSARHAESSSRTRSDRQAARPVHRANAALAHLIQQAGGSAGTSTGQSSSGGTATVMGTLDTHDQALDQVGTHGKTHRS